MQTCTYGVHLRFVLFFSCVEIVRLYSRVFVCVCVCERVGPLIHYINSMHPCARVKAHTQVRVKRVSLCFAVRV